MVQVAVGRVALTGVSLLLLQRRLHHETLQWLSNAQTQLLAWSL